MTETRHLGFAARYATRLVDSPDRANRVAALLVDSRWPWRASSFTAGELANLTKSSPAVRIGSEKAAKRMADSILDPTKRLIRLKKVTRDEEFSEASIDTGTFALSTWDQPFRATGHTRGHDLPEGHTVEAWISLVHDLMVALDVASAILPVYETDSAIFADIMLMSITRDSRWTGTTDLGPGEDFAAQNDRANYWRDLLGAKYVRNARWGTYLRDHHIDAVGGIDRIRREVEPARIDRLGELVYFQLTESIADAVDAACDAKRRAFDAVLAPILPPPIPPRDQP